MSLDRVVDVLPFSVVLSIRSQLTRNAAPTILAICAVAASTSLAACVELASRSVDAGLERSVHAIAGAAEFEVTNGSQGVPEELVDVLRVTHGVYSASPVIQENVRLRQEGKPDEVLRLVGIDLLYDREIRDYGISESGLRVSDPIRLLSDPGAVVVPEEFAKRLGVSEGAILTVRAPNGLHSLTVRGFLSGDLANAFGGSLAVMDVYALQAVLGIEGVVGRIDVASDPESRDQILGALQSAVAGQAAVTPSRLRENLTGPVLAAYSFGVWAITLIGILLALFLTYAVISTVVDRRTVEFALLRAAGMDSGSATTAVVVDAVILAAVGTLVGTSLAALFSGPFIEFFSQATEFYRDLRIAPQPFSWATVAVSGAVGMPMALLACIEPSRRAGKLRPLDIVHERASTSSVRSAFGPLGFLAIASSCAFVWAVASRESPPAARLGTIIASSLVGVWSLASMLLPGFLGRAQDVLANLFPRVGVLVGASIGDRPMETGLTIAVWSAVVASAFGLLTSLENLGESMDSFMSGENGRNAVLAFSGDAGLSAPAGRIPIDPSVVARIAEVPGVTGAWGPRSITVMHRGEEVLLEDYDVDQLLEHGGLVGFSSDDDQAVRALKRGDVLASEAFLSHFGLAVGDDIELPTIDGVRRFQIGGTARSFSGPKGKLAVSSTMFSSTFRSRGASTIIFWTDEPGSTVVDRVRRIVSEPPMLFREGEAFQKRARRVIGAFSALLTLPLLVVSVIGVIGLANLLVGNVASRRRDLALIRASGGSDLSVVAVVAIGAGLVALLGTITGLWVGYCWALVIRDAITHFLGWTMSLAVDPKLALALAAAALSAACVVAAVAAASTWRDRVRLLP